MAQHHVHHVHIFASDIGRSVEFYTTHFGAEVVVDAEFAGARNVFLRVGKGRIHLYDQSPRHAGRGSIHHFGIQTDDINADVARLRAAGVHFTRDVTDLGSWKYIMVPAPDHILIELFQVDKAMVPREMRDYFE